MTNSTDRQAAVAMTDDEVLAKAKEIERRRLEEFHTKAREIKARLDRGEAFTPEELLFAAGARCRCGAGMAYPMGLGINGFWDCSAILMGTASKEIQHSDRLPFALYEVHAETSIRAGGRTTRPEGTVARTVGSARCPKCHERWESEPYNAPAQGHHWRPGPCPKCGYAVGAGITWSSSEGEPIETRYRDVVLRAETPPAKAEG